MIKKRDFSGENAWLGCWGSKALYFPQTWWNQIWDIFICVYSCRIGVCGPFYIYKTKQILSQLLSGCYPLLPEMKKSFQLWLILFLLLQTADYWGFKRIQISRFVAIFKSSQLLRQILISGKICFLRLSNICMIIIIWWNWRGQPRVPSSPDLSLHRKVHTADCSLLHHTAQ